MTKHCRPRIQPNGGTIPLRSLITARLFLASCSVVTLLAMAIARNSPAMAQTTKPTGAAPVRSVSFQRDVRPLLSNLCSACHGPDEKERKANLRLDTQAG